MLEEEHCALCAEKGLYVFPNGEKMCRSYYEFIVNEVKILEQLKIQTNSVSQNGFDATRFIIPPEKMGYF